MNLATLVPVTAPETVTPAEVGTLLDLLKGDILALLANVEGLPPAELDHLMARVESLIELRAAELHVPGVAERHEAQLLGAFAAVRRKQDAAIPHLARGCRMALKYLAGKGPEHFVASRQDVISYLQLGDEFASTLEGLS